MRLLLPKPKLRHDGTIFHADRRQIFTASLMSQCPKATRHSRQSYCQSPKIEAFSDALHVALEISPTGSGRQRRSVWASERKPKKLKPIGRARARVRESQSYRQNMRYNGT